MSVLTDYLPGYNQTTAPPKAFTVSYEWNWDHNESWPRQAHGMPPVSYTHLTLPTILLV